MRMTPRIHSVVFSGALIIAAWFTPFASGQDAAAAGSVQEEVKQLRQLIEQQSKQLEALTVQITRLGGELERRNIVSPSAALPVPKEEGAGNANADAAPAAPAAKVVTPAANVHIVVKGDSLEKI